MAKSVGPLPQWSWDELEIALDRLGTADRDHPVRAHMMCALKAEAAVATSSTDLLTSVLSMAALLAQTPGSVTALHREDRSFG